MASRVHYSERKQERGEERGRERENVITVRSKNFLVANIKDPKM